MADDTKARVHEVIGELLDEGEIAVCWVLTIEVVGPNGVRYLAHRAGGGINGDQNPSPWAALGMLRSSARIAEDQVAEQTRDTLDDEDDD